MSVETKHTPGPWKFEDSTKTIRSATENYWLASMDSWDGAVNHAANARLIAAAPEMLRALEHISRICSGGKGIDMSDDDIEETFTGIRDIALKAIAKAEGN